MGATLRQKLADVRQLRTTHARHNFFSSSLDIVGVLDWDYCRLALRLARQAQSEKKAIMKNLLKNIFFCTVKISL